MDTIEKFEVDQSRSRTYNFMTKKGFKRALILLIASSFLNLVYTFFEKISDKQFQRLFIEVFGKMEKFPDSNNSKSDFDS